MGIQTYTFHNFTLMEALEKTRKLELNYAEAYFSQELGQSFPQNAVLNFDLPEETKEKLQKEFSSQNITWYASGVAFYNKETDWRRFFEFASEMGLKLVTAEPELENLDMVEALAKEFNIEVAIHNHPEPSVYARPEVLKKALEGRSELIGVCADIGHWYRTGADPLQAVKHFRGRLKVVHMKDLNENLKDTIWGTGILPLKEIVQELLIQDFNGLISVEYENFSGPQMDDISKNLNFIKDLIKK
jgi:sugar phosphate isomerase/epimerase